MHAEKSFYPPDLVSGPVTVKLDGAHRVRLQMHV